jgi:broad specificity phosphatase PhoE
MKLCFIRHGESEANTQHVISNRESSFHLTELGRKQATALVEKLSPVPIAAIYASPIRRARETADILSDAFRLPYQRTEALREYDCGILEERSDEESWRLHRHNYEDWTLHQNYSSKPEGGECFLDIRKRFVPFIESLMQKEEEHVLLIGHGGLFHLMLPLILSNIDQEFVRTHGIGHTQWILAESMRDKFVCKQWGDIQF